MAGVVVFVIRFGEGRLMFMGLCTRMRETASVALVLSFVMVSGVPHAQAQSAEDSSSRLDHIERDLIVLQRQVYRTQSGSGLSGQGSAEASSSTLVKLGDIEERIRDLTGQIETLSFQIQQNKERIERMAADNDFRFRALEGGAPKAAVTPSSTKQDTSAASTVEKGALPVASNSGAVKLTPPSATQDKPVVNDDAKAAYAKAFTLLQRGKYAAAQQAFQAFLDNHKDHALAGNAQYWLGETHYVRGEFEKAAVAFADGYKSYKKSPKAADSLLKLGFSMRKLGKSAQSCAAFGQLLKEYPKSSKLSVQLAKTARSELKCP